MAEGGYDPETTNPFDPHGDDHDKDTTPLIPRDKGEEIGMKKRYTPKYPPRTSTSTSGGHGASFIPDTHTSNVELQEEEEEEEIESKIKGIFYKPSTSLYFSRIDEYNRVMVKLRRINAKEYELINSSGELAINLRKLPKGLRDALGKTHVEDNNQKYEEQNKEEEKQREREKKLEEARRLQAVNLEESQDATERLSNLNKVLVEEIEAKNNAKTQEEAEEISIKIERIRKAIKEVEKEVDGHTKESERLEQVTREADARVEEGERQVETARERVNERLLSLRDRIKEIFKKIWLYSRFCNDHHWCCDWSNS